jgi:hypothetical protein
MYAYAGNNPLSAVDPDGLDYYLVGGDQCGTDTVQCDKQGFVVNDKGQRTVVTDQDVLNGTNGVHGQLDANGNVQITTAQGTFQGQFFDQNPFTVTVSLSMDELKMMSLQDAGRMSSNGANVGMAVTAPAYLLAGASVLTLSGGGPSLAIGEVPTAGQVSYASRLAAEGGKRALQRALRSTERRLAEHLADLERYRQAGGYTSSVEREIAGFRGQIQALQDALSKLP